MTERCNAVSGEILVNHKRVLFREFARSLFGQLRRRRRVLAERQLRMLETLLDHGPIEIIDFLGRTFAHYQNLKHPDRAQVRDLIGLYDLGAVALYAQQLQANLEWPQQFSQSELLERYQNMPSAVSANHPAMAELSRLLGRRG